MAVSSTPMRRLGVGSNATENSAHMSVTSGPDSCGTSVLGPNWTTEEQRQLEAGLRLYPAQSYQPLERYLRIAATLPSKTARDVALRARWLAEGGPRRRKAVPPAGPPQSMQLNKGGRPLMPRPASMATTAGPPPQPAGATQQTVGPMMQAPPMMAPVPPPYIAMTAPMVPHVPMVAAAAAQPMPLDDHGGASVGGVGGPIAVLLEANYAILNQFKVNMQHCRVHENTDLLMRFRDNILSILHHMNNMPGVMSQMPPLPVRMNVELANNFLPTKGLAGPMGPPAGLGGPEAAAMAAAPSSMPIGPMAAATGPGVPEAAGLAPVPSSITAGPGALPMNGVHLALAAAAAPGQMQDKHAEPVAGSIVGVPGAGAAAGSAAGPFEDCPMVLESHDPGGRPVPNRQQPVDDQQRNMDGGPSQTHDAADMQGQAGGHCLASQAGHPLQGAAAPHDAAQAQQQPDDFAEAAGHSGQGGAVAGVPATLAQTATAAPDTHNTSMPQSPGKTVKHEGGQQTDAVADLATADHKLLPLQQGQTALLSTHASETQQSIKQEHG